MTHFNELRQIQGENRLTSNITLCSGVAYLKAVLTFHEHLLSCLSASARQGHSDASTVTRENVGPDLSDMLW